MFEDFDTEFVDLNGKTRESLIPDPEGNEIRNLAKSKGFTAVSRIDNVEINNFLTLQMIFTVLLENIQR